MLIDTRARRKIAISNSNHSNGFCKTRSDVENDDKPILLRTRPVASTRTRPAVNSSKGRTNPPDVVGYGSKRSISRTKSTPPLAASEQIVNVSTPKLDVTMGAIDALTTGSNNHGRCAESDRNAPANTGKREVNAFESIFKCKAIQCLGRSILFYSLSDPFCVQHECRLDRGSKFKSNFQFNQRRSVDDKRLRKSKGECDLWRCEFQKGLRRENTAAIRRQSGTLNI